MKIPSHSSRRQFFKQFALTTASLPLLGALAKLQAATKRLPVIVFSKALQDLNYEDTADLVAEVGWDGIECPVRRGGQVVPERIEDDLPRLVEILAKRKLAMFIMTTDITSLKTPHAERILRAASRLGIKHYRLGGRRYRDDRSMPEQLKEAHAELRDLAALNRELGLCAGFQNHSGGNNIGAPVWDIHKIIHALDPKQVGIHFDIGHATVEGGYAWRIHARLMEPYYSAVYVKDFAWRKSNDRWQANWCPLGQGMISREFIARLPSTSFQGPISQHHEYDYGKGAQRLALMKQDLQTLKSWLAS